MVWYGMVCYDRTATPFLPGRASRAIWGSRLPKARMKPNSVMVLRVRCSYKLPPTHDKLPDVCTHFLSPARSNIYVACYPAAGNLCREFPLYLNMLIRSWTWGNYIIGNSSTTFSCRRLSGNSIYPMPHSQLCLHWQRPQPESLRHTDGPRTRFMGVYQRSPSTTLTYQDPPGAIH